MQQFQIPVFTCCNLVLVWKDITHEYGRTSSKRFLSAVGTFSFSFSSYQHSFTRNYWYLHQSAIWNTNIVEGFTKSELNELWRLATKESYFIFNGLFYKQTDGVAMGSPIGPFFCFFQPSPFLADEYFFNVLQRRI